MELSSKISRLESYMGFQTPLIWSNAIGFAILHGTTLYSTIFFLPYVSWLTIFYVCFMGKLGGVGVSLGAHRLWTHRSYKASTPVRYVLMVMHLLAGHYSIAQWVRDHRCHHRFADTDADPHNASRGFFFAHCGWLMLKRHPDMKEKGKEIDISDVLADPVIQFHQKYFIPLLVFFHGILPQVIAYYWLGESVKTCFFVVFLGRYTYCLNFIWCINSVAHFYGYKPYNKSIKAVQSKFTAMVTAGEGWHNFHHVFPFDYRIGELGQGWQLGCYVIDILAWLGLATDLRTAPPDLVKRVMDKNLAGLEPTDADYTQLQHVMKATS